MADISELESKFLKADAAAQAGDVRAKTDASLFAAEIKRQRQTMTHTQSSGQGNRAFDPTKDMSGTERFLAGAGSRIQDYALGARQAVSGITGNTEELRQQVREKRTLDEPLAATPGGRLGGLAGDVAMLAPTASIPGAASLTGSLGIGAAAGFMQPSTSGAETAANTALGAATAPLGYALGKVASSAVSPIAPLTPRQQNASNAINAGYSLPPSEVNPSLWNRLLSGGNKHRMADEASLRNSRVLGENLSKDLPGFMGEVTPESLATYRAGQYESGYRPVERLPGLPPKQIASDYHTEFGPPSPVMGERPAAPDALLHDWMKTNGRISQLWNDFRKNGRIETMDAIDSAVAKQKTIQANLENAANAAGRPDILAGLRQARTNIAKSHNIERSMADTSNPTAGRLASTSDSGKLSAELETAYKAAKDFPDAFKNPARIHPSTAWGSTAIGAGLLGAVGDAGSEYGGLGHTGVALAALPFIKGAARSLALSRLYQQGVVNPEASAAVKAIRGTLGMPGLKALADELRRYAPAGALSGEHNFESGSLSDLQR